MAQALGLPKNVPQGLKLHSLLEKVQSESSKHFSWLVISGQSCAGVLVGEVDADVEALVLADDVGAVVVVVVDSEVEKVVLLVVEMEVDGLAEVDVLVDVLVEVPVEVLVAVLVDVLVLESPSTMPCRKSTVKDPRLLCAWRVLEVPTAQFMCTGAERSMGAYHIKLSQQNVFKEQQGLPGQTVLLASQYRRCRWNLSPTQSRSKAAHSRQRGFLRSSGREQLDFLREGTRSHRLAPC